MKPAAHRPLRTAPDLARALRASRGDAVHWRSLTPAARRMASRWIDGANAADVRAWRIADVLCRAERYAMGRGPFYPTDDDQRLLARRRRGRR